MIKVELNVEGLKSVVWFETMSKLDAHLRAYKKLNTDYRGDYTGDISFKVLTENVDVGVRQSELKLIDTEDCEAYLGDNLDDIYSQYRSNHKGDVHPDAERDIQRGISMLLKYKASRSNPIQFYVDADKTLFLSLNF